MSGSETECDGCSDDELTPVIYTQQSSFMDKSEVEDEVSYLQSLSQLDSMMPPVSQPVFTHSRKEIDSARCSHIPSKRASILVPPQAVSTPKSGQRPPVSQESLRLHAMRIIKTLPRGEVTMWGIMQTIDYNDMRLLCKFKGVKVMGRANKAEMGGRILKYIQRGEFRSIFKSIAEQKNGMRNLIGKEKLISYSERISKLDNTDEGDNKASNITKEISNEVKSGDLRGLINTPNISSFRANLGVPIPLVSVGGNENWKFVDNRKFNAQSSYKYQTISFHII